MIDRRYTQFGHVVHAIERYGPFADILIAVCGTDPHGFSWLGTGSQGEREKRDRMPRCGRCSAKLARWDW